MPAAQPSHPAEAPLYNLPVAGDSNGNQYATITGTANANWYGYNVQKTGPGTITYARTGGTVNVYAGASLQVSNGIVQAGGTVDPFSDNSGNSSNHVAVAVDHGATLQFTGSATSVSTVGGLAIDAVSGAKVDIGRTTLKIDFSGSDPVSSIRGYLQSAFTGGSWKGSGLTSSIVEAQVATAKGTTNGTNSIGYSDGNTDATTGGVVPNQMLIAPELTADANMDGKVDFNDLLILAQNNGLITGDWTHADFNYDSKVDFNDLLLLAQNVNQTNGTVTLGSGQLPASFEAQWALAQAEVKAAGVSNPVPEPGTMSLLAISAAGLLARRRRTAR